MFGELIQATLQVLCCTPLLVLSLVVSIKYKKQNPLFYAALFFGVSGLSVINYKAIYLHNCNDQEFKLIGDKVIPTFWYLFL
jgi:hypothetical protein